MISNVLFPAAHPLEPPLLGPAEQAAKTPLIFIHNSFIWALLLPEYEGETAPREQLTRQAARRYGLVLGVAAFEKNDMAAARARYEAALALFPELGISAYSNEDLFHQDALLEGCEAALGRLVEGTKKLEPVIIAGAPLRFEAKLFNCGVVIHRGRVLGITPKTYLPNYREFYELRQFTPGDFAARDAVRLLAQEVPFGPRLVFRVDEQPLLRFAVEKRQPNPVGLGAD